MLETLVHTLTPARRSSLEPHLGLSPVEYVRKEFCSHSLLFPNFQSLSSSGGWFKTTVGHDDSKPAQLLPDRHIRIVVSRWAPDSPVVLFDSNSPITQSCKSQSLDVQNGTKGTTLAASFPPTSASSSYARSPSTVQDAIAANDADLELMLACAFGSTVTTYKGVTEKLNVIPLDFNIGASRTTRLVRPGEGFGQTHGKATQIHGKQAQQVSESASLNPSGSNPHLPKPTSQEPVLRRRVILTRTFSALFSDFPVTDPNFMDRKNHSNTHFSARDSPSKETCETVRWSPRFGISVLIELPVRPGRETDVKDDVVQSRNLSSTITGRLFQNPAHFNKASFDCPNLWASSNREMSSNEWDDNVGLISQNWSMMSRILCWLQQISESRLISAMRHLRGTAIHSMLAPHMLENDMAFCELIMEAQTRIVRGLSIPKVLCGQSNWTACREEIDYFGRFLGSRERNRFLSRMVTAFLAHNLAWLPQYLPREYRKFYLEHVEATASSECYMSSRTVVLYQDPIVARTVIFLLTHFLPTSPTRRPTRGTKERRPCLGACRKDSTTLPNRISSFDFQSPRPVTTETGCSPLNRSNPLDTSRRSMTFTHPSSFFEMYKQGEPDSTLKDHCKENKQKEFCQALKSSVAKPISIPVSASPSQTWHAGSHLKAGDGRYSSLASRNLIHTLQKAGSSGADSLPGSTTVWGSWKNIWGPRSKESESSYGNFLSSPDESFRESPYKQFSKTDPCCSAYPVLDARFISLSNHPRCSSGQFTSRVRSQGVENDTPSAQQSRGTIPISVLQESSESESEDEERGFADDSIRISLADDFSVKVNIPFFDDERSPIHHHPTTLIKEVENKAKSSTHPLFINSNCRVAPPSRVDLEFQDRDDKVTQGKTGQSAPANRSHFSQLPAAPEAQRNSLSNRNVLLPDCRSKEKLDADTCCYAPPSHVVPDNVAGILSAFHPDFALQALAYNPGLESSIRGAMRLEKTPIHHFIQLIMSKERHGPVGPHMEKWVDVCSTLIVDLSTFSIKRLLLQRLIRLPSWLDDFAAKNWPKKPFSRSSHYKPTGKAATVQTIHVPETLPHFPRYQESQSLHLPVGARADRPSIANLEELVLALSRDSVLVTETIVSEVITDNDPCIAKMLDILLEVPPRRDSTAKSRMPLLASGLSQSIRGPKMAAGGVSGLPDQKSQPDRSQRPDLARTQSFPTPALPPLSLGENRSSKLFGRVNSETSWFSFSASPASGRNEEGRNLRRELTDSECDRLVARTLASVAFSCVNKNSLSLEKNFTGHQSGLSVNSTMRQTLMPSPDDSEHGSCRGFDGSDVGASFLFSGASTGGGPGIEQEYEPDSGSAPWQRTVMSPPLPSWLKLSPVSVMRGLIRGGSSLSIGSMMGASKTQVQNNILRSRVREWLGQVAVAR